MRKKTRSGLLMGIDLRPIAYHAGAYTKECHVIVIPVILHEIYFYSLSQLVVICQLSIFVKYRTRQIE